MSVLYLIPAVLLLVSSIVGGLNIHLQEHKSDSSAPTWFSDSPKYAQWYNNDTGTHRMEVAAANHISPNMTQHLDRITQYR